MFISVMYVCTCLWRYISIYVYISICLYACIHWYLYVTLYVCIYIFLCRMNSKCVCAYVLCTNASIYYVLRVQRMDLNDVCTYLSTAAHTISHDFAWSRCSLGEDIIVMRRRAMRSMGSTHRAQSFRTHRAQSVCELKTAKQIQLKRSQRRSQK